MFSIAHYLHVISLGVLVQFVPDHIQSLEEGNDLHDIDIQCPHPDHRTEGLSGNAWHESMRVRKARRVVPLDLLHQHVRTFNKPRDPASLLARNLLISDDAKSYPLTIRIQQDPALIARPTNVEDASPTNQQASQVPKIATSMQSTRPGRHATWIPKWGVQTKGKTVASHHAQYVPQSYRFSADGATLLLWKPGEAFFFSCIVHPIGLNDVSDLPDLDCERYCESNIRLVCAGSQRIATISYLNTSDAGSSGRSTASKPRFRLQIFRVGCKDAEAGLSLTRSTVKDIAMSSDDKNVAVAFGGSIEIYGMSEHQPNTLRRLNEMHVSGPSKPPESQILRFSSTSDLVAVMTLHVDHASDLTLDAYDLEGRIEMRRSGGSSLKIPNLSERTLTSIHYLKHLELALISIFGNAKYQITHNRESTMKSLPTYRRLNSYLQGASLSPNEDRAVLVDGDGKLWRLDMSSRTSLEKPPAPVADSNRNHIRVGPRQHASSDSLVAIATTAQLEINVFWIDTSRKTLHLETISTGKDQVRRGLKPISLPENGDLQD